MSTAGDATGQQGLPDEPEPDALAKGWVEAPGSSRAGAVFVLTGNSIGVSRVEPPGPQFWLNLDELVNLDAIGDPVDDLTHVEITMTDERVIGAGWPEDFCDAVVAVLVAGSDRSAGSVPAAPAGASIPGRTRAATPFGTPEPTPSEPAAESAPTEVPAESAPVGASTAPAPGVPPSGALELEDVVYLGGFPGQSKRRKKCTVAMSRASIELRGPGVLFFRIGWDVVRTVEVQNSDEARFRMNTKIHRDASALVIECDQGVTILLEARECPALALRSAISQLLDGLPTVVV